MITMFRKMKLCEKGGKMMVSKQIIILTPHSICSFWLFPQLMGTVEKIRRIIN